MSVRCTTCLALLFGLAGACGGGGTGGTPDAPSAEGHELTIALFKHVPFVDGDTEPAPLLAVQDGDSAWTAVTAEVA